MFNDNLYNREKEPNQKPKEEPLPEITPLEPSPVMPSIPKPEYIPSPPPVIIPNSIPDEMPVPNITPEITPPLEEGSEKVS